MPIKVFHYNYNVVVNPFIFYSGDTKSRIIVKASNLEYYFEGDICFIRRTKPESGERRFIYAEHYKYMADLDGEYIGDKQAVDDYLSGFIGSTKPSAPYVEPPTDYYPINDAFGIADVNSIGDWTRNGPLLSVEIVDVAPLSIHSFRVESYAPGGQDYIQLVLSGLTIGQNYDFIFKSKFIGGGLPNPNAKCTTWLGVAASPDEDLTLDADWVLHTIVFQPSQNQVYIRFWVVADTHDGSGDVLLLDKARIWEHTTVASPV